MRQRRGNGVSNRPMAKSVAFAKGRRALSGPPEPPDVLRPRGYGRTWSYRDQMIARDRARLEQERLEQELSSRVEEWSPACSLREHPSLVKDAELYAANLSTDEERRDHHRVSRHRRVGSMPRHDQLSQRRRKTSPAEEVPKPPVQFSVACHAPKPVVSEGEEELQSTPSTGKSPPGPDPMVYTENDPELLQPWRQSRLRRKPRKALAERMRALRERILAVPSTAMSHPLGDSGEERDEPSSFRLRPEVSPSTSRPAACPARVGNDGEAESASTTASRRRSGKARSRPNRAVREQQLQEVEVQQLGNSVPGLVPESLEDRVRAWRELSHQEHVAATALADQKEQWVDAWVPEGWRRYRRRWARWHGTLAVAMEVTKEGAVQLSLETECGTLPGTGGDVPGVPDAWCSLFRVHQWNQREREAAEEAQDACKQKADGASLPHTPSTTEESVELEPDSDSDSDRLNFTQQIWEGQLRAMDGQRTPTRLTSIRERVEPIELTPIAEDLCGEKRLEVRRKRVQQLFAILEDPEEPVSVEIIVPAMSPEPKLPTAAAENVHQEVASEEDEPLLETHPLGSKTARRASRREREQERRRQFLQLREEICMEGGWYFGPERPLPERPAPAKVKTRIPKLKAGRVPLHHPVRAAICAHLRRDGQVVWDSEGQLTAVRDEEGTLLLVFWALLKGQRVRVLVDSGASDEFISTACAKRLNLTIRENDSPLNVTLADGSVQTSSQVAYGKLTAETSVGTYSEVVKMRVLPLGIKVDIVLGGRWLRSLSPVTLDYAGWGSVIFRHRGRQVRIAGCSPGRSASRKEAGAAMCLEPMVMLSATQAVREIKAYRRRYGCPRPEDPGEPHDILIAYATPLVGSSMFSAVAESGEETDADVSAECRQKFEDQAASFKGRVIRESLPNFEDLRKTEFAHIRMHAGWDGTAPAKRPYKMSMVELNQLRERLDELLSKGYIRPSSSPFAAPVLMVPKPGKPSVLRMVVDYRCLNSQTIKDKYPLPDIQQLFDEMHGAKYFSSFDAVDGFWQMAMAPEDVEKTAFTSPYGSYEWLVMPMGLANSPSCYQRRMQRALGHLPFVRVFIDDAIIFSSTLEEHFEHLRRFFEVCEEQGIYLKESKCQMLQTQIRFLGHVVNRKGSQPQHDKLAAIRDWPDLENATHVRQFLGLAGYYRRYVLGFSEIAHPLTQLTKGDVAWEWGPMQKWAFEEIKKALCSQPTLALPDMKAAADGIHPFVVQTDASGVALGGVLMQDVGEGLRPIAFESRQFSGAEQNYHAGERELCALHHCTTQTWRHYLIFTEFQLQGDHKPLVWLMSPGQPLSRRQARWYMDLVEVGVPEMEYIPGALLWVPDALSRRPDYKEISAREGLMEAGFVNPNTDQPQRPGAPTGKEDQRTSPFRPTAGRDARQGRTPLGVIDPNRVKSRKIPDTQGKSESAAILSTCGSLHWLDTPELWLRALETLDLVSTLDTQAEVDATLIGMKGKKSQKRVDRKPESPSVEPSDRQDWKLRKDMFEFLEQEYGPFDADACCDLGGQNRQVNRYWTDCLKEQWRGLNVWCNPPFSSSHITIEAVLRKYVEEWRLDPEHTSAVFILPDFQSRMPQWRQLFRAAGMRIEYIIPTHDSFGKPVQMFESPDGTQLDLPWPVLVVHAPAAEQKVKRERKTSPPPDIILTGEAARVRDLKEGASGGQFLKALKAEYQRTGPLKALRKEIMEAPHQRTRDFCVVGEVLWRISAGRYQLVLGEDSPLREVVMQEAHASLAAGHAGRDKTLERVLRRFWWKRAADDVGRWVSSCTTCQAVRPRNCYPDGLLNPHTIPTRLWQVVSVDFVTGLPVTARNHDAFVTFTCKLSKMVHVVPLNFQDSSAEVVARIYFDHVWRLHGAPLKMVSDRDPRFQDAMWKELMRLMGVKVASTTPYNPRSDGQAEHTNRVVEDMLRSFVGSNPEDWDQWCTNVEFAINDTRSDVTGFTPFELVLGHSPMSQLDIFLQAAAGPSTHRKGGEGTAHELAGKFAAQLEDARAKLELAQQRQRAQFDQRHRTQNFQVGDLVWVEARHLTENIMNRETYRKLSPRWHGPLAVTERFFSDQQRELPELDRGAPVAYRLKLPPKWRIHDVFAQHRLKPYVSASGSFAKRQEVAVPAKVMVDGQAQSHVEKILARRVRVTKSGKEIEEFQVRWTGYSKAHDEWKTREDLNYGGLLEPLVQFEQNRLSQEGRAREKALRDARLQRRTRRNAAASLTVLRAEDWDPYRDLVSVPPYSRGEKECLPWESYSSATGAFLTVLEETSPRDSSRPLRILVLFSGTGSVEAEFRACYPQSEAVTVDCDSRWQPTFCEEVQTWDYKQFRPKHFDVIWGSPPCTEYSQAKTTGVRQLRMADACVRRTLQIIDYLQPRHWFLENPLGRFPFALRFRPVVRGLGNPLVCSYCQYGMDFRKPTCIWTSTPPTEPLRHCTGETPCMHRRMLGTHPSTAQLGPHPNQNGAGASSAVYPIPASLLRHLFQGLFVDKP